MPVLPLVGSTSSLPGPRVPRFSASQTMDAPIRHFTLWAGLRPSTLTRMVAFPPSITRFRRTSGVWPMLCELSSKTCKLDLPIQNKPALLFLPSAQQVGEGGLVDHTAHRLVDLLPHVAEGRVGFPPGACFALVRAFDEAQDFADGQGFRGACQQIAALSAAPRFDKAGLLEAGQDQFEELLRNLLTARDVGDADRFTLSLRRQIEYCLERVLTFDGYMHLGWGDESPVSQ